MLSSSKSEIKRSVPGSYQRLSLDPHQERAVAVTVVAGADQGKSYRPEDLGGISVGRSATNHLSLEDRSLDLFQAEFTSTANGIRVRDLGASSGVRVGSVRVLDAIVPSGTEITLGETRVCVEEAMPELGAPTSTEASLPGVIGNSPVMQRVQRCIRKLAGQESNFILEGEMGTGKETLARAAHALSPRVSQPFVMVECRGKSVSALAAELFGYEKGAFPGADRQHLGAFERANHGTLILSDAGDLHIPVQASVFSALKHRRMRRLGSRTELTLDLQVITTTRRDIRPQVNHRGFRDDLYELLASSRLVVPPLRERPQDIDPLLMHFLRQQKTPASLGEATLRAMRAHRWSGNVAELKSVVLGGHGP